MGRQCSLLCVVFISVCMRTETLQGVRLEFCADFAPVATSPCTTHFPHSISVCVFPDTVLASCTSAWRIPVGIFCRAGLFITLYFYVFTKKQFYFLFNFEDRFLLDAVVSGDGLLTALCEATLMSLEGHHFRDTLLSCAMKSPCVFGFLLLFDPSYLDAFQQLSTTWSSRNFSEELLSSTKFLPDFN